MWLETINQSQNLLKPPKRNEQERKSRALSELCVFKKKEAQMQTHAVVLKLYIIISGTASRAHN